MKKFSASNPAIPIADHVKPDGSNWTIKEKLWLGLTPQDYKKQFFRNWVNWIMIGIFVIGVPIIIQRYLFGLGTVTHSSNDYPWGLFLGFGLFGMVPLSASGFMLGTTVEIFGRKDFIPIERLALLNGLLRVLLCRSLSLKSISACLGGSPIPCSYPLDRQQSSFLLPGMLPPISRCRLPSWFLPFVNGMAG